MQATDAIFYIAVLVMSVVIHEVAHGFAALHWGDRTAEKMGRLTLNPFKHLDLFGSVILPALLYFSSGFVFGWAKPVPYNPDNFTNRRKGTIAVAAAGVLANLFIALFFGLLIRFAPSLGLPPFDFLDPHPLYLIAIKIVLINISLALFNLVPIPPLDGSKILFEILPRGAYAVVDMLQRYSLIFLIIFVVFFADYLFPLLSFLYQSLTGLPL